MPTSEAVSIYTPDSLTTPTTGGRLTIYGHMLLFVDLVFKVLIELVLKVGKEMEVADLGCRRCIAVAFVCLNPHLNFFFLFIY